MAEEGQPRHRLARHLEHRVLVIDRLLDLVMHDAPRADRPERRRLADTDLAGGVDRLAERVVATVDPTAFHRRDAPRAAILAADDGARALDHAVAQLRVEIGEIGDDGRAGGVAQHDRALGADPLVDAVIDDGGGRERALAMIDLDIARRRHRARRLVKGDGVGHERHRRSRVDRIRQRLRADRSGEPDQRRGERRPRAAHGAAAAKR
jgi:hypothetical protein